MLRFRLRDDRATPYRQHDQRRTIAQRVVKPRETEDADDRRTPFGFQEQEHALEDLAWHCQRSGCACEQLAATVRDDALADGCRQQQGVGKLRRERGLVAREGGTFEHGDGAACATRLDPRRRPQRRALEAAQNLNPFRRSRRGEHLVDRCRIAWLHRQFWQMTLECALVLRRLRLGRRSVHDRLRQASRFRQAEPLANLDRRFGIDREAGADHVARGLIDLVDQSRRQFHVVLLFFRRMARRLDVEVRQHAQQRRSDVHALPLCEIHQPVETRE